MQPHQERVVNERAELNDKVDKLGHFILNGFGAIFNSLTKQEQLRLSRQHTYMLLYLNVLDERIAAF